VAGVWNNSTVTIASNSVVLIAGTGGANDIADVTLTNYGTVAWASGTIRGGGDPGTVIYNFGLWDAQSDETMNAPYCCDGVVFNNFGTFRKSAGTNGNGGNGTLVANGVLFNQLSGVVDVQHGNLTLQGSGNFTGGYITTNATGTTVLSVGNFNINGTFTGSNVVENSGNLTGINVINGALNWVAGVWNNATVTIPSNSIVFVAGGGGANDIADVTLTNYGTVAWASGTVQGGGDPGTFIYNFGLWDAQSDQTLDSPYCCDGVVFNNFGTFRKSSGTNGNAGNGTLLANGVLFNQFAGMVDVQHGSLTLQGSANFTGGYITTNATGTTVMSSGNFNINGTSTGSNVVENSGNLTGVNVINGALNWVAGIWNYATVTVTSNSIVTIAGGGGVNDVANVTLNNYGTVVWASGTIQGGGDPGTVIYNYGLWDAQSDQTLDSPYCCDGVVFNNSGTFRKSAATSGNAGNGTLLGNGVLFNQNSGVVDVQHGSLTLQGSGNFTGGYITTNATGRTVLSVGNFNINGTSTGSNVVENSGNLTGVNVINGALTWVAGIWNYATVTVTSNSIVTIDGGGGVNDVANVTLTNYGAVVWSSGTIQGGGDPGTVIYNYGLWDAQSDQSLDSPYCCDGVVFNNYGTFRKSVGSMAGSTVMASGVLFNQSSGTLEVLNGNMVLQGSGNFTGGTIPTFVGGTTYLSSGNFNINGTFTGNNVVENSGNLVGANVINGALTWVAGIWNYATVTVASNSTMVIAGGAGNNDMANATVTNYGTLEWASGTIRGGGDPGTFIYNYGVWDAQSDDAMITAYCCDGTTFNNVGLLRKSGGTNTSNFGISFVNNGGRMEMDSGQISLGSSSYLQGGGAFTVTLGGTNAGQSGQLATSASATLNGRLYLNLDSLPPVNSQYQILSCNGVRGTFSSLNVPTGISVIYTNSGVFLSVTSAVTTLAITQQPVDQAVQSGSAVSFSVVAISPAPPAYRWFSAPGRPIVGATDAVLTLPNVTLAQAGSYSVVVSNAYGVITSRTATLTVANTAVSITSPINLATFSAPADFAISASASDTAGISVVDFYDGPALIGAGSSPPYSIFLFGQAAGSHALTAVAVDDFGLSKTSAVVHITVNTPGTTLIDFEALNASATPVGGSLLSNYLAGFGAKATNVTAGTGLVVADDQEFLGGGVVVASSGNNFLVQTGTNVPVSYQLLFSQPYASVSWVRPQLLAGTAGVSLPQWRAHIFDNQSNELGSVGENAFNSFTNVPAARFTLSGRNAGTNIASIRFDGNNQGLGSLSTLPLDDLLLSTIPMTPTLSVSLTNNGGTSFSEGTPVVLNATVSDSAGTVSEVNFFEGSNLVSAVPLNGGMATLTLRDLAAGTYTFTAVASDNAGATSGSLPVTVTVTPVIGLSVINFDALNTSAGSVGGVALSNYLSTNFGVTYSNVTLGTALEAVNAGLVTGNAGALASSPPNYFTQEGLSQPVSFTLVFRSPLQAFGFTRVALVAGTGGVSHPQWMATAFDANGVELGSAGEGLITSATNVPARNFILTGVSGDGITSVRFDSDSQRTATFSAVLLDDLILNSTNASAIPPALAVSLTTSLPQNFVPVAPATITLDASVTDNLSSNYSVSYFVGPTLLGSANSSPYSFVWRNVLAGVYVVRAQVVDGSGVTAFSSPVTVTVGAGGNSAVVNFDSLNASAAAVTGTALSNYLAGFGMKVATNISPGALLAVENQEAIDGGGAVAASSPPNIVTQIGSNGPVSYTLTFATPLTNFGFTRPELLANPFVSHPEWQATAFDAAGVAVAQAGEGLIGSYTNVGAQSFNLSGPGIASVQFASEGSGLTTFNAMVADDFILTTNGSGVNFPPAVAITNPATGLQVMSPVTLTVTAQALDPAGIASVSFYDGNGNLIGTATSIPYQVEWSPASGSYGLIAVAMDSNGLSRTSPPVSVSVSPSESVFGIVNQPISQTADLGSSVTFSVTTTATGSVGYQWYQNDRPLVGQTGSSLILFPVASTNAGSYTVTATEGDVTLTSTTATLSVAQPPTITTQPVAQTVSIGTNVTLSVTADANGSGPLTWQWLLDGTDIPGATNSTFSIPVAQPFNSGSYQAIVGNSTAFVKSAPAEVMVQAGSGQVQSSDYFSNRIVINPLLGPVFGNTVNATAEPGEPSYDGKTNSGPYHSIWYTWTASFTGVISLTTLGSDFDSVLAVYTGTNLAHLTRVAFDDDSAGFFQGLVTFNVSAGTIYQITVDGFQGAAGNVVLGMPSGTGYRVLNPPSGNTVPVIATNGQPTNQLVQAGSTVTLSIHATSTTPLTYQWYFQGAPVGVGRTGNTLTITNFQAGSVGLYYVLVANAVGSVPSQTASIQIAPPNQPGSAGPSEDKFGNAVDLAGGTNSMPTLARSPASGGGDSRGFSVSQVFSTVGATKEQGEPNHCGQAGGASQWFIYTAPTNGILDVNTSGSSFNTIVAVYTSTGTVPSFTNLVAQGCGFATNFQTQGQPNVIIPNVLKGTRFFIVVDGYQGASGTVRLHIGLGQPPALISPPANQFALAGSNATFNVTAVGSTNFGFQWLFNGVSIARATNASLALTNLQIGAIGSYTVIVSNVIGVVTSAPPATLTLITNPVITAGPTNVTVTVTRPATLGVTVVGVNTRSNPLRFQWFTANNSVLTPVAHATNTSLSFPVTQFSNNGSYLIIVSNNYASVTSTVAVLTVTDTNRPSVAFTGLVNFTTNSSIVTVSGSASDNYVPVTLVQAQINGTGYVPATGTTHWTNVVTLVPGSNIITAQSLDLAGNLSLTATNRIFYRASSLFTLQTNGVGRVTSTSGATNGARLALGSNYTILATSVSNYLFQSWSSGVVGGGLTNYAGGSNLTFTMYTNMVLQANFVTNPFPAVAGIYDGLFYPTTGVTEETAGLIQLQLTPSGAYGGKIYMGGMSASFIALPSQSFSGSGLATNSVPGAPGGTIKVMLQVNFGSTPRTITGQVVGTNNNNIYSNGVPVSGWISDFTLYASLSNSLADAPEYNFLIPPMNPLGDIDGPPLTNNNGGPTGDHARRLSDSVSTFTGASPTGYGYGLLAINPTNANVILTGALADGTTFSQSVPVGEDNGIPFFASYSSPAGGIIMGQLSLSNTAAAPSGEVTWIRKSRATGLFYAGFTNTSLSVMGSYWSNSITFSGVIDNVLITNGGLTAPLLFEVSLSGTNLVMDLTTNVVGSLNTNTGQFTLHFQDNGTQTARGVFEQNLGAWGYGFFTIPSFNPTNAGAITLQFIHP
jgi:hypothetical protein